MSTVSAWTLILHAMHSRYVALGTDLQTWRCWNWTRSPPRGVTNSRVPCLRLVTLDAKCPQCRRRCVAIVVAEVLSRIQNPVVDPGFNHGPRVLLMDPGLSHGPRTFSWSSCVPRALSPLQSLLGSREPVILTPAISSPPNFAPMVFLILVDFLFQNGSGPTREVELPQRPQPPEPNPDSTPTVSTESNLIFLSQPISQGAPPWPCDVDFNSVSAVAPLDLPQGRALSS